jgi:hypothetical protein
MNFMALSVISFMSTVNTASSVGQLDDSCMVLSKLFVVFFLVNVYGESEEAREDSKPADDR